jgi:hypothetical protein
MLEPFAPKPTGRGDPGYLTGRFAYDMAPMGGLIEISEGSAGVLTLDYSSNNLDYSCQVENLTISRNEAERYVAKGLPVPFYSAEENVIIKLAYFENGVVFTDFTSANNAEEINHSQFCGIRAYIITEEFYLKK